MGAQRRAPRAGHAPRSEHIHPRGLTALGSTLATWRRRAGMNSWGGCSPVRRRGSPPSGATAPAPQAAPATPVAANKIPPAAPRVLGAEDLEFATVAEALQGLQPRPRQWPTSRAKVRRRGPLGRPVFAYLSALEPFVHLLSEGEEDEMSVHQWLVSVAWLTAIVASFLARMARLGTLAGEAPSTSCARSGSTWTIRSKQHSAGSRVARSRSVRGELGPGRPRGRDPSGRSALRRS